MPALNLNPTDNRITAYYDELQRLERLGATNETAVRLPFPNPTRILWPAI